MVRRVRSIAVVLTALVSLAVRLPATAQQCAGDCNADLVVSVDELVLCSNVGLARASLLDCAACDAGRDGHVTVDDLIASVASALGFSLQGVCYVPCQGPECELPEATANGLVPCAPGTDVKVSRCTNRASCLQDDAGRTASGTAAVGSSGVFEVGVDGCPAAGSLFLVESGIEGPTRRGYRTLVSFDAAAGLAEEGRLALEGDVVLDPSSEAALAILDELGLGNFTDEGIADVLRAVAAANAGTLYANRNLASAVVVAFSVANEDPGVQDALMRGRVPTPTPPPPTRTPPTRGAELEIGSVIAAPNSHATIGVTLNLSEGTEVVGTLNDFSFETGAGIAEMTLPMGVLARSVSATDTTLPLDDASGLPPFGTIQIDDEMIAYGFIDGNVLVAGGCVGGDSGIACAEDAECSGGGTCDPGGRGQAGTVAAPHDAGATVLPHRMPDCHMSPALEPLNKNAVFSFFPPGCDPAVDCDTVRAIVIALDNLSLFPMGETLLYTCRVHAGPAEGTFPLTCEEVQASSPPDGEGLLPATCLDGEVVIQQGVPTETPTPTRIPATATPTPTTASFVALDVGSASGQPGDTVQVDITFQVAEAEVIATDNRLSIDSGARILGCEIAPELDNFSAVVLEPGGCDEMPEAVCTVVRVVVFGSLSAAIQNGTLLYSCQIEILPATQSSLSITCSDQSASSPQGQPFDGSGRCEESVSMPCEVDDDCASVGGACRILPAIECRDGLITVSVTPTPTGDLPTLPPTPTPTPTPTATPGDTLEIRIGSTALVPNSDGTFDVTLHVGSGQQVVGVLNDISFGDGATIAARMMVATVLSADIGPTDTAILVGDATALPEFGFVKIDDERVVYVRQDGNVLAVGDCSGGGGFCADDNECGPKATCDPTGRGQNGTMPASHSSGTSVEVPMGSPDCVTSPELKALNKDAVFSFLPEDCVPGVDCDTMRAIIIGLGNLSAFPVGDTALYSCAVLAGAEEGTFPLECTDAQVSGPPDEGLLDATCVDGEVFVHDTFEYQLRRRAGSQHDAGKSEQQRFRERPRGRSQRILAGRMGQRVRSHRLGAARRRCTIQRARSGIAG